MQSEISLGRATSNAITGHTTPAEAVADNPRRQMGKGRLPRSAPRLATTATG